MNLLELLMVEILSIYLHELNDICRDGVKCVGWSGECRGGKKDNKPGYSVVLLPSAYSERGWG